MRYDLNNKVVIITGASSGIGRSLAEQLHQAGCRIVLAARNEQAMGQIAATMEADRVLIVKTDVADNDQVQAMVDAAIARFGRVDILINNAGVGIKGSVATVPIADYRRMVEVNQFGVVYGIRAVYPVMKTQGQGLIVNVSSVAGFKGFYDSGMYSSTKFAVNGLSESLGEDARKDNIKVLLVCPGKVETSFEENVLFREDQAPKHREGISADEAAAAIIRAMKSGKEFIVMGKKCKPLYWLNRMSPRLTNYIIRYIY